MHDEGQEPPVDEGEAEVDNDDKRVMGLLHDHVPLSLLVDLSEPDGPHSQEILEAEGQPEDAWWLQDGTDKAAEDPEG